MAELEKLDEDRLAVQQNLELYWQRMSNAFNTSLRLCSFQNMIWSLPFDHQDHRQKEKENQKEIGKDCSWLKEFYQMRHISQ